MTQSPPSSQDKRDRSTGLSRSRGNHEESYASKRYRKDTKSVRYKYRIRGPQFPVTTYQANDPP